MTTASSDRKVFIIGVDGGTLEVIQPLVEKGLLPTFARLMQEGAWGTLRSTVPPVTPVAWASFMTGQNPARHHILDFLMHRGDGTRQPVNASVLEGRTLWRLLSEAGKQVGVINVPMTFPPEPVNGFLISGLPMPPDTRDYTHPPSLAAELEAHGWNLADIAGQAGSKRELDAFIAGLYRRQEDRIQATLWLMEQYEWDLIMLHLFETDRIQHEIFNYWTRWVDGQDDPESIDEDARRYGPEMARFFQATDKAIARLWQRLDQVAPGSTLVIMSDHGFGPTYRAAHLYNWLMDAGLMVLKPSVAIRLKKMISRIGLTPVNFHHLLPRAIRRQLHAQTDVAYLEGEGKSPNRLIKAAAQILRQGANSILLSFHDVDWHRTRAYCTGSSGIVHIYVNLQGREPHGSVPPEAYESTREEIIAALRTWKDPIDGGPVISEIYRREEIYSGPYLEEAADVLALFRGDSEYVAFTGPYFLSSHTIDRQNYTQPDRATHKMNGLVMIRDERILPGRCIDQAHITDLAPTILYLMDLPVPSDMDGSVIQKCFSPTWLQDHPIQTARAQYLPPSDAQEDESSGLSAEEEVEIVQMLKDLGYVD